MKGKLFSQVNQLKVEYIHTISYIGFCISVHTEVSLGPTYHRVIRFIQKDGRIRCGDLCMYVCL